MNRVDYLTIILRGRAGYEMIILYPASLSRIIVLLKTLRDIIENLSNKR